MDFKEYTSPKTQNTCAMYLNKLHNPILKWVKDLNKVFPKEHVQRAFNAWKNTA